MQDDFLCPFGFCRKGVKLEVPLGTARVNIEEEESRDGRTVRSRFSRVIREVGSKDQEESRPSFNNVEELEGSNQEARTAGKRHVIEVADSSPHSSPKGLTYRPDSTLLKGLAGSLVLILMQKFISNFELKTVQQDSKLELDEQITLGFFRVKLFSFLYPCFTMQALLLVDERTYRASESRAKVQSHQKDDVDLWARNRCSCNSSASCKTRQLRKRLR